MSMGSLALALLFFSSASAAAAVPRPLRQPGPAAPEGEPAPWTREQVEDLVRGAVCVVTLSYSRADVLAGVQDRPAERLQPGFLASSAGIVVTNYSAIHPVSSIAVELRGESAKGSKYKADLVGIDEPNDIAILRLTTSRTAPAASPSSPGATPPGSKSGEDDPEPDSTTSSEDAGPSGRAWTFISLEPSAVPFQSPTWTALATPDDDSIELIDVAELVEVSPAGARMLAGPFEDRLGGQPLIDAHGRLIGAWRWQWPGSKAAPSWISAKVIRDLVNKYADARPIKNKDRVGRLPRRSTVMPNLSFRSASKSELMDSITSRTTHFLDQTACPTCQGKGWVPDVEVKQKWRGVGTESTTHENAIDCRTCKTARVRAKRELWRAARTLAIWYAELDPRKPQEIARSLGMLQKAVQEAALINAPVLIQRLNDCAKPELSPGTLTPGRAIVCTIPRPEWSAGSIPDWDRNARLVDTAEFGPLLVSGPETNGTIGVGSRALVVGVVAGLITIGDAQLVRLEGCFVVPISETSPPPKR
jgi:hypothetical protein